MTTKLNDLLQRIIDIEQTFVDISYTLSDLAQDVRTAREELEQKIDEERYYHEG